MDHLRALGEGGDVQDVVAAEVFLGPRRVVAQGVSRSETVEVLCRCKCRHRRVFQESHRAWHTQLVGGERSTYRASMKDPFGIDWRPATVCQNHQSVESSRRPAFWPRRGKVFGEAPVDELGSWSLMLLRLRR